MVEINSQQASVSSLSKADERIREMQSYNHLYEKCVDINTRKKAVHDCIVGRHSMKHLEIFASDEEGTVEKSEKWITHYKNAKHHEIEIYDGISRKKRTIVVPTFEELVVQHCVVTALKPVFYTGMYEHSYASIPGRGAHKGAKMIRKWISHTPRNCRYVLKMDIRHFFQSIPHDILKEHLRQKIHDEKMLRLICQIIDVTDEGLPLGFFTSQWFSNWYLMPLDHYIKEVLGAAHYIRYMDDMVIFGSNRRKLHKMRKAVDEYLQKNLGLHLKDNWCVFRFDHIKKGKHYGRDLDFMGFRFFRDRTVLRRSIYYKMCRKAKRIAKKEKPSIYEIKQMLSYLGWLKATDTYNAYLERVKPYVNFGKFKKRISAYDRRKNNELGNTLRLSA